MGREGRWLNRRDRGHRVVVVHFCKNHYKTGAGGLGFEMVLPGVGSNTVNYTPSDRRRGDNTRGLRVRKEFL